MLIINHLFQKPIIDAQAAKTITGTSFPSVYKMLNELEELKILIEITGGKRGKLYAFKDYLNLFK